MIRALKFKVHFPLEVRFLAAHPLWLSSTYQPATGFDSALNSQGAA